jgi:hypothetical protein
MRDSFPSIKTDSVVENIWRRLTESFKDLDAVSAIPKDIMRDLTNWESYMKNPQLAALTRLTVGELFVMQDADGKNLFHTLSARK